MPDDRARKIAEEALARLASELEAGRSETLKNYLSAMGRFHRYSWRNTLLIGAQRPTATHVAGFHAWHDLERSVKKGEKGIMIFAPMVVKRNERHKTTTVSKDAPKPDDVFRLAGFRTAYVFDVSQTEGKPLPAFAETTGDPKEFGDKLKALVTQRGISIEYDASIAPAQGMSSGGRIRLVPGLSPAEEFSVMTHELAHEILHHHADAALPPKTVRETQAEAVAFVVCCGVGLETSTAAADYIALYNGDKKALAESLAVVQRTSAEIFGELLPEKRIDASEERGPQVSGTAASDSSRGPTPQAEISQEPASEILNIPSQDPPVWDR